MLAFCLVFGPVRAFAQSRPGVLRQAQAAYAGRNYQQVVTLLQPALYPNDTFTGDSDRLEAHKLLGLSRYWLSIVAKIAKDPVAYRRHQSAAEKEFVAVLGLRPGFRLTKSQYPDHLVTFFERVRRSVKAASSPLKACETELTYCRDKRGVVKKRFEAYRKKHLTREVISRRILKRHLFLNFVPFGAGQFQNGQPLKGAIFATTQGAMLIWNVSLLILGETSYVRNGSDRYYKRDDASAKARAADFQRMTIASGVLFWSLVAWGIIDALVFYKTTTIIKQRQLIPIGNPNISLSPEIGRDRFVLGLEARF